MEDTQTANDARLYAIGDIHGRLDLLERVIDAIKRDVAKYGDNCRIVTLGDYIDRGLNSRGVLDRLMGNPFPGLCCFQLPLASRRSFTALQRR